MELSTINTTKITSPILAKTYKRVTQIDTTIKKSMLEIAWILAEIDTEELYSNEEYKTPLEFSEKVFGFKKTTYYSFLAIGKTLLADKTKSHFATANKDFNISALGLLLSLSEIALSNDKDLVTYIKELLNSDILTLDMSIAELRKVIKYLKSKNSEHSETEETTEEPETEEPSEEKDFSEVINLTEITHEKINDLQNHLKIVHKTDCEHIKQEIKNLIMSLETLI